MKIWQLGNTSVRSAMRIKDGIAALSTSKIQGNIRKGEGDFAFRNLLGECGVVSLGQDPTNSVGRKWRSAMGKLGFIYPHIVRGSNFVQSDLGTLDTITPAGWNLVRAETVAATQECFLRAMVTPMCHATEQETFSPLCWTLAILLKLEKETGEPAVSFIEMALIVQISSPVDGLELTVKRIIDFRAQRNASTRKRTFDREQYDAFGQKINCKPHTFIDYADMNMRYLKATGMVQSKGKGIVIIPEKHYLAIQLTHTLLTVKTPLELYRMLCNGANLPTDHADVAYQVVKELLGQLINYGITYSLAGKHLETAAQVNQVRYEIEELISEKKEEVYARKQAFQWEEIAAYMDLIASRKDRLKLDEETEIRVPRTEAPAYLEWSLWRAFLAIDTLANKPYEVRRFKIDQDFFPVSTAPGNGPDLIAEFTDYVVVIEVTLSESSRQEAMEGEPVRRHVADLMQQYHKPVYGLFIANRVDSNTAETFRIGVWYTREDKRLDLHIVPFTLRQFSEFFKMIFKKNMAAPELIIDLIDKCEECRTCCEAPAWKSQIDHTVNEIITNPNFGSLDPKFGFRKQE